MNKLKRILAGWVMFAGLLGLGTAEAAFIRGTVDPPFNGGGPAAGTYWSAIILFDTDVSCLQEGLNVLLAPPVTCANNAPFNGYSNLSVNATLGGLPISFPIIPLQSIALSVVGGAPVAISAPAATGAFGAAPFFLSSAIQGNAWLSFSFNSPVGGLVTGGYGTLFLEICGEGTASGAACTGNIANAFQGTGVAVVNVIGLPEPPITLLLLAAMPVAWLVRRRRAQAR